MSTYRTTKNQQGLTIVELMIALVLSLVLVAGVIQVYISNNQAYRVTEASSRIQENARFAFRFLTKETRMAGFSGCAGQTMTVTNTVDKTASGFAFLYEFGVAAAVEGFESTSGSGWTPTVDSVITGDPTSPLGGSDILVIRGVSGEGVEITSCNGGSSDDLTVLPDSSLKDEDIVVAGSCSRASIFQITGISGTDVEHGTVGGTPGNADDDLVACYAGGQMWKISTRVFYVANDAGILSLYKKEGSADAEVLIEGVEEMQVLYGVGDGVNNVITSFETADNVTDWDDVISARVSLLMQSVQDNITTEARIYTFNGVDHPSSRRLRNEFTTTIAVRNRLK